MFRRSFAAITRLAASAISLGAFLIPHAKPLDLPKPFRKKSSPRRRRRRFGLQTIIVDHSSSVSKFERNGLQVPITKKMVDRHIHSRHKRPKE